MTDQATFSVTFAGREVLFRQPTAGQIIILRRRLLRLQAQAAQSPDQATQLELASQLVVDTLSVVESLVVDPADVEYLEESMLTGKIDHTELMAVIGMKAEPEKPVKKTASKTAKAPARARTKR
jgi:hypothetical protein